MEMPPDWKDGDDVVLVEGEVVGHDGNGRNIGVHSLAIRSDYQKKGIGRSLMDEYIKYARNSLKDVDNIVIIAHDHLIQFYESFGFENMGPSPCAFGGGGWHDMVSVCCVLQFDSLTDARSCAFDVNWEFVHKKDQRTTSPIDYGMYGC